MIYIPTFSNGRKCDYPSCYHGRYRKAFNIYGVGNRTERRGLKTESMQFTKMIIKSKSETDKPEQSNILYFDDTKGMNIMHGKQHSSATVR